MKNSKQITKKQTRNIDLRKSNRFIDNLPMIFLIAVVLAIYIKGITNDFILNWDDSEYLHANPYLKTLSIKGIYEIFSNYFFANYHPITTLTYLLEYQTFGLNPIPYHITNLVIHCINIVLVYVLISKLIKNKTASLIVASLFAVHPMHVESVAWISERKDLLYSFFFLLSLIKYIEFTANGFKTWHYIQCLILFLLSLLSKSAAAVLAPLLFLFDYWFGIPINKKTLLNKIPFFILSFAFGLIAIFSQQKELKNLDVTYNFLDRILLVNYNISFYIVKFFIPLKLSVFYPYPEKINGLMPVWYYIASIFVILFAIFIYKLKKHKKIIIFGLGFYLITLLMVLQIIPVGKAITADRYSYLPYIGLSFIIAKIYVELSYSSIKIEKALYKPFKYLIVVGLIVFSFVSFNRVGVWKNDISVFTDASSKFKNVDFLHNNLGVAYYRQSQYVEAIACYDKAIELNKKYEGAYYNRGNCKYNLNDFTNAIADYNKAIELDAKYTMAYSNRCTVKSMLKQNESALLDCCMAIKLDSNFADAYLSRGCIYLDLDSLQKALYDFNKAVLLSPDNANNLYNRANTKIRLGDTLGSLADYNKSIELNPMYSKAYYNRASINYRLGKRIEACNDWKASMDNGYQPAEIYFKQFCN